LHENALEGVTWGFSIGPLRGGTCSKIPFRMFKFYADLPIVNGAHIFLAIEAVVASDRAFKLNLLPRFPLIRTLVRPIGAIRWT